MHLAHRRAAAPAVTVAAALAVALVPAAATADTVTLPASLDATIYADAASGANAAGEHLTTGQNSQGAERRALLAFDLSTIPAGSTINEASLTLYASRGNGDGLDVALHRVLAPWGEGTSNAPGEEGSSTAATAGDPTWTYSVFDTTAWTTAGGDHAPIASATTFVAAIDAFHAWDGVALAADVQAWLDDPASNHGWIAIGAAPAPGTTRRFDSRTFADAARQPALVVDFDPPVATGVGGGGGSGGAGGAGTGGDGTGGDGGPGGAGGDGAGGDGGGSSPGAGGAGGVVETTVTVSTTPAASAASTTGSTASGAGGAGGEPVAESSGDGCDCTAAPGGDATATSRGAAVGAAVLLGVLVASRRRRRTERRSLG